MKTHTPRFDWRFYGWWILATTVGLSVSVGMAPFVVELLVLWPARSLFGAQRGTGLASPIGAFVWFAAGLAVLQWLVLRRHMRKSELWIVATFVGLLLGIVASGAILLAALFFALRGTGVLGVRGVAQAPMLGTAAGMALGFFVGMAQWLALRRSVGEAHGGLDRWAPRGGGQGALWWLLSNLLGWTAVGCLLAYALAVATGLALPSGPADPSSSGWVTFSGGLAVGGLALAMNTGPALIGLLKALPERQVLLPQVLGLVVFLALWVPVAVEPPTWPAEEVELGRYDGTSLGLDPAGRSRISYCDVQKEELKYAAYDGAAWQVETVDSCCSMWTQTSLALDRAGWPHISYACAGALKYAYFDGTSWQVQVVDDQGRCAEYNSLAVDADGRPHISYSSSDSDRHASVALRYAYYDGTAWWVEAVDSGYDVGEGNSLALDSAGFPRISYKGRFYLAYAYFDGTSWYTETVGAEHGGNYTSLALDSAGYPHISYYRYHYLAYAYYDGTSWQAEEIARTEEGQDNVISLALDTAGHPHISYGACPSYGFLGLSCSGLRYAHRSGSGWRTAVIDWDGGGQASLALDGAGQPYVSYLQYRGRDPYGGTALKLAHRTTSVLAMFGRMGCCVVTLILLGALLFSLARG